MTAPETLENYYYGNAELDDLSTEDAISVILESIENGQKRQAFDQMKASGLNPYTVADNSHLSDSEKLIVIKKLCAFL